MSEVSLLLSCAAPCCRFAGVKGIAAFDLDTFLEMAQRTRKWQCPHSMRNMSVRQLHLDGWMMQVLQALQASGDAHSSVSHPECSGSCKQVSRLQILLQGVAAVLKPLQVSCAWAAGPRTGRPVHSRPTCT